MDCQNHYSPVLLFMVPMVIDELDFMFMKPAELSQLAKSCSKGTVFLIALNVPYSFTQWFQRRVGYLLGYIFKNKITHMGLSLPAFLVGSGMVSVTPYSQYVPVITVQFRACRPIWQAEQKNNSSALYTALKYQSKEHLLSSQCKPSENWQLWKLCLHLLFAGTALLALGRNLFCISWGWWEQL